jgi:hypothetical protein
MMTPTFAHTRAVALAAAAAVSIVLIARWSSPIQSHAAFVALAAAFSIAVDEPARWQRARLSRPARVLRTWLVCGGSTAILAFCCAEARLVVLVSAVTAAVALLESVSSAHARVIVLLAATWVAPALIGVESNAAPVRASLGDEPAETPLRSAWWVGAALALTLTVVYSMRQKLR